MSEENQAQEINLKRFLSSMRMNTEVEAPTPMVQEAFQKTTEEVSDEDRFLSGLAAIVVNVEPVEGKLDKGKVQDLVLKIDQLINNQINEILHTPQFQEMEATWRSVEDLVKNTPFKSNVMIDILDVGKDELYEDFEDNSANIIESALFRKIYVAEYDQFGGRPFGIIAGLFEFEHTPADIFWLQTMGKVSNASHAPFIASVGPKFFGCQTIEELGGIKDLEGLMNQPKYGDWAALRDTPQAAYIGLTLPKYILRKPWHPDTNPCKEIPFEESVRGDKDSEYLWGPSTILLARNMGRSFAESGWCQYLRGPKGGGLVSGLPAHTFNIRGEDETKIPVELSIPDYRELEFANCGFIPAIFQKGTSNVCFFSVQSLKKSKKFKDPKDSENSQLVTNLSYTLSITRIAHYVKSIMRDNIGSSADGPYIKATLENWISQYVTTVVNPDDRTLRYYPFKAYSVNVTEKEGMIGWYHCEVAILPHIQFEGMDVELRLESRL